MKRPATINRVLSGSAVWLLVAAGALPAEDPFASTDNTDLAVAVAQTTFRLTSPYLSGNMPSVRLADAKQ